MILVDTHVVLWLALEPDRISNKARMAIQSARDSGEGLAICDITLLELMTLSRKGRIHLQVSLESFLAEVEKHFSMLSISSQACVRSLKFPASYPKDPADRIIGATALVHGMPLVTADYEIRKSRAVPTIW